MSQSKYGIFHGYGLFWRRDEIEWAPGKGKRREFRLLGRVGQNSGTIRVANFREQAGIYILYGDLGPYYVGLTRRQTLGDRLKQHISDEHKNRWDRFSWFSFARVLKSRNKDGLQCFRQIATVKQLNLDKAIGDIEAVLMKAMAVNNKRQTKFAQAEKWEQIKKHEVDKLLERVRKG